jgi:hypothetical protein
MKFLASLFVGKPLNILVVTVSFVAAHLALRHWSAGSGRSPRALLVAAGAWALYAAWEWLVQVRTPEADIRVDLLVIWPVLAVVSAWSILRAGR